MFTHPLTHSLLRLSVCTYKAAHSFSASELSAIADSLPHLTELDIEVKSQSIEHFAPLRFPVKLTKLTVFVQPTLSPQHAFEGVCEEMRRIIECITHSSPHLAQLTLHIDINNEAAEITDNKILSSFLAPLRSLSELTNFELNVFGPHLTVYARLAACQSLLVTH